MKAIQKYIGLGMVLICFAACNDLTEINVNPNQLGADRINSKYVLTSAIAHTTHYYIRDYTYGYTSDHGISEAMQYLQRDYIGYEINSFVWKPLEYTSFKALTDSQTLLENSDGASSEEERRFYKGVASVLRAFWFGFYTSAWGDIPYTQAMQGNEQLFKPQYDTQKDVFKGIVQELKFANEQLAGIGTLAAIGSSDLLFGGNALKWQRFANSLRIRYYLRLAAKKDELKGENFDLEADLREILANPAQYPVFESSADNAAVSHPGTDAFNSWVGGPLPNSNRSQFYRRKPCSTIIDYLKKNDDPRLTTWFRPVDVQLKVGTGSAEYAVEAGTGQIVRYVSQYNESLDTSRFVGLKPALGDPNIYNLGATANLAEIRALNGSLYLDQGANPHVSYLADIYAGNTDPLVKAVFMSFSELNFLLAEAALKGWIGGDAPAYFRKAVESSLDQYQLTEGVQKVYDRQTHLLRPFSREAFVSALESSFREAAAPMELLMEQKWVALWMTPEFWFDWRRTALPDLSQFVVEGSNGSKIPVRLVYGTKEYVVNEENTRGAVSRLQPAEDNQWAKMWLLQGGDKPW